jgi:hypothetical protein
MKKAGEHRVWRVAGATIAEPSNRVLHGIGRDRRYSSHDHRNRGPDNHHSAGPMSSSAFMQDGLRA